MATKIFLDPADRRSSAILRPYVLTTAGRSELHETYAFYRGVCGFSAIRARKATLSKFSRTLIKP